MSDEFKTHRLNDQGLAKCDAVAGVFERALTELRQIMLPTVAPGATANTSFAAREQALVVTKLQEACFFAKRAVALDPANKDVNW